MTAGWQEIYFCIWVGRDVFTYGYYVLLLYVTNEKTSLNAHYSQNHERVAEAVAEEREDLLHLLGAHSTSQ